jgi:hypothetical protein
MKVFLSFSGDVSRKVALALRDWLPKVIQVVRPFISEEIGKGERWSDEIANELSQTAYGIICVTRYNFKMPWINFEAGAISKAIHKSYVSPFLFGIDSAKIYGPLQQFQSTVYKKEDVFRLLSSINNRLDSDVQLPHELLEQEFEKWWPELCSKLDGITDVQEVETETGFDWLYTADDLARKQARIKCKHIWVITPDLYRRTMHPQARDIMKRNLEREISYTFLTVSSSKTSEAKRELKRIFDTNPNSFKVKEYQEKEFHRLAVTDYIVLNPDDNEDHPLHVFLELPIETRGYWIEVDGEAAVGFVDRFKQLVGKKSAHGAPNNSFNRTRK